MQHSTLLASKLRPPSLPVKWVPRPHLVDKLNDGWNFNRQLTLVSAPAGFGKTSSIAEWIKSRPEIPVAWLSLEEADDDPIRFLIYFIGALKQVEANLGVEIDRILQSGQLPPGEIISTTLVQQIQEHNSKFIFVLDDLQVIQDAYIHKLLEDLILHCPQQLHLVLLTREDPPLPLARLRANNRLTEIRARDLRFSRPDIDRFLKGVMEISLSDADLAVLENKIEGWVVGLQLAGLSLRDRENPSRYIASLSGTHRSILSYLTEEVLSQQSNETREFLLHTSILERLNANLCDAVTGRTDSRQVLERLLDANLFLTPLDYEGRWYRYHRLFADLLRDIQESRDEAGTAALHLTASRWYAQAKMTDEAIHHALAARDYTSAMELIESNALDRVMYGYAKTVYTWVNSTPEKWQTQSPRTNLAFAWMHLLRGSYAQASPYLERLERLFSSSGINEKVKQSTRAEWLVMRSLILNMERKFPESLTCTSEALELAPQGDNRLLSLAYFGMATTYQALDDYDRAVEAYQKSIDYGKVSHNPITEMMSISGLTQLALEHGQLHLAYKIAHPACQQLQDSASLPPISMVIFGILGEVYYQWNQLEQAQRHTERALQLSRLGGIVSGEINCSVMLSRVYQQQGNIEKASRKIEEAIQKLQVNAPGYIRQEAVSQQVRVYLARNRPQAAQIALQRQGFSFLNGFTYPELPPDGNINHSIGLLYNSSLLVLLHQAATTGDLTLLEPAIDLAGEVIDRALHYQYMIVALEAIVLRARMHGLLGNQPDSRADYLHALELALPEGILAVFIENGQPIADYLAGLAQQDNLEAQQYEYIQMILSAMDTSRTPPGQPVPIRADSLVEPLTERELEVLRLMSEGLKYKEIAERLYISLNTVRTHTKSIYSKLNVSNRTRAIQVAGRLNLL